MVADPNEPQATNGDGAPNGNRPRTEPIRLNADGFGRFDVLRAKREHKVDDQLAEQVARADEDTPAAGLNALPEGEAAEPTIKDPKAPWLGREKTMLPTSKPPEAKADGEAWIGREQTMIPVSKPTGNDPNFDQEWNGAEQTMVGAAPAAAPAAPAADAEQWDGKEKTMVPVSKPDDGQWDGKEKTMVGVDVSGNWLGREKTMIGIDGAAGAAAGDGTGGTGGRSGRKGTSPTLIDGWHLKGRKGPLTGKPVGDYDVGGILGEGGMGTVYRARQISLKRRVALKVLPSNLSGDARLRERFEQEARTASLINSVHVVQVFAAGQADDVVYFAMEFVEGTDLAAVIDEKAKEGKPFSPEEAAGYIIQAGKGLAEAGRHGIVHRDIKPPNLMITGAGIVKIADFGISKVAGEHSLTMTGTAVGTPAYVSPEQGRGDKVDQRSDLYSLGVVFYELLVGQKPFDGATANALIYQHNYAEPKLPKDIRPDLPEEYQAVALKCLQKDPAKRYQTADELVADLERIRAGSAPMTAMLEVFGTGADEAMRRLGIKQRKILPYLIAATLILALGGGIGAWWYDRRGEIVRLQKDLAILDKSQAVDAGARDKLAKFRAYVGDKNEDVQRWTVKLSKINDLDQRLGRLDQVQVIPVLLRGEAERDLHERDTLVGSDDQLRAQWLAALTAADEQRERVRGDLRSEIDAKGITTTAQRDRLSAELEELKVRAGEDDSDVERWQTKVAEFDARLKERRERLAVLDDDGAKLVESDLAARKIDLDALIAAVDAGDIDAGRWSLRLAARGENLSRLHTVLLRLDQPDLTFATTQALANDLAAYKSLVDSSNPDLKRWVGLVETLGQSMAAQKARLARLDNDKRLTVGEVTALGDTLKALKAIAGEDDDQVVAWSARLRAEQDRIALLHESIARLDKPETLTVEQQEAAANSIAELDERGALGEATKRAGLRRLKEDGDKLTALRSRLKVLDQVGPLPASLAEDLATATRLIGAQDPDLKKWNLKASEVAGLRALLAPLDGAATPPAGADAAVARLGELLGANDDQVARWRDKLKKVAELGEALALLDQPKAFASDTVPRLAQYTALVGNDDPAAARWNIKAARVAALKTLLKPLPQTYILPPEAPAQAEELKSLLGPEEQDVARWGKRIVLLEGPPKPVWASAMDRDERGIWADLEIKVKGRVDPLVQRFRYIPAGSGRIGSPLGETGREKDEVFCKITLSKSFWLADSECVQGLWDVVGVEHDSRFRSPERPVERVSWDDCQHFLIVLNQKVSGLKARLPTEAEWEYACRAGSEKSFGDVMSDQLDTVAWYDRTARSTKEVKRRQPNLLGLFDMHGNVWEWCQDRYGTYSPTPVTDWVGKEEDTRVARGGSWGDGPEKLRCANRLAAMPDLRTVYLGMRLAAPVDWPEAPKIADKH